MQDNYELCSIVLKAAEAFTLHHSDKASIEIGNDALAVPIKLREEEVGYVFLGQGRLLVDAIVETEEGAFGKPVQRVLDEPFLMLGDAEQISQHFSRVSSDELKRTATNEKAIFSRAQEFLDRFSSRNSVNGPEHACSRKSWVFAFSNGDSAMDFLVTEDSRLVYTTKDMSFISKGEKSILHTSGQVVLSKQGRPFVVDMSHQPHDCC